jgi:hypothetical protein
MRFAASTAVLARATRPSLFAVPTTLESIPMTEQDQWIYDVFGFGMALNFYLRQVSWPEDESFAGRLVRTLREIAEGEITINPSDTELRLGLAETGLPENTQNELLAKQPATRARHRVIAAKLVELLSTQPNN